jgi:hypothetical protein
MCAAMVATRRFASISELADSLARFVPAGHEASRRIASIQGNHRVREPESEWPSAPEVELEHADEHAASLVPPANAPRLAPTQCEIATFAPEESIAAKRPRVLRRVGWWLFAASLLLGSGSVVVLAAHAAPTRSLAARPLRDAEGEPADRGASTGSSAAPEATPSTVVTATPPIASPLESSSAVAETITNGPSMPTRVLPTSPSDPSASLGLDPRSTREAASVRARTAPSSARKADPLPFSKREEPPSDDQIMGGRK